MAAVSRDHSVYIWLWDPCMLESIKRRIFQKYWFFFLSFLFSFESYHYQHVLTEWCFITWSDKSHMEELLELCLRCTAVLASIDHGYLNCCCYIWTLHQGRNSALIFLLWNVIPILWNIWFKKHIPDEGKFILITAVSILPLTVCIFGGLLYSYGCKSRSVRWKGSSDSLMWHWW